MSFGVAHRQFIFFATIIFYIVHATTLFRERKKFGLKDLAKKFVWEMTESLLIF
jgi:hypothetical protein